MTRLAIVAFPTLPAPQCEWVEGFRARHDPQASRLAAHFTLLFPADVEPAAALEEARAIVETATAFAFEIEEARVVLDRLTGRHQVFLVPGQGAAELRALHDAFYAGRFREHLRADLPFAPHVTVADSASRDICEGLAAEAQARLPLRGRVDQLHVLEVAEVIREVGKVPLRPGGGRSALS